MRFVNQTSKSVIKTLQILLHRKIKFRYFTLLILQVLLTFKRVGKLFEVN